MSKYPSYESVVRQSKDNENVKPLKASATVHDTEYQKGYRDGYNKAIEDAKAMWGGDAD